MSDKYRMMILTVDRKEPTKLWPKHIDYSKAQNYISQTAKNLLENGGFNEIKDQIYLYDSGSSSLDYLKPTLEQYPYLKICQAKERIALNPNTMRAWKDGLDEGARWIITVQDDIVCSKNTFLAMDKWVDSAPKNTGVLSLWSAGGTKTKRGHSEWAPSGFWGSLFLIFPRTVLELFFNSETYKASLHRKRGNDMMVKGFFGGEARHLKIYAHQPSLVQHIGTKSTWCHPSNVRRTGSFKGENHNALKR